MADNEEVAHVKELIDGLYTAQERISRSEILARVTAAELPADLAIFFDRLPEGDYEEEELVETLNQMIQDAGRKPDLGQIPQV
jgi:hypothetical protein